MQIWVLGFSLDFFAGIEPTTSGLTVLRSHSDQPIFCSVSREVLKV